MLFHAPGRPQAAVVPLYAALAERIAQTVKSTQDVATAVSNLSFFRRDTPTGPCACMVEPGIVLVVQGAKQMITSDNAYTYDTQHFLITALDLPASSQVLEASPKQPCLGLVLKLDLRLISELIAQGNLAPPFQRAPGGCIGLGTITPALLEPFVRLLDLLDEPHALPVLAPLIQREIHFRLLMSDQADRLMQIASAGSQSQRIARAITWLKDNYALPLRIDELAARAQMSTSSLHHHFRQMVAMSPLQYQKWLRLNEARRLMLNEDQDAANAAYHVGYESPSQFSREYTRMFGTPPKRDIQALRRRSGEAGVSQEMPPG